LIYLEKQIQVVYTAYQRRIPIMLLVATKNRIVVQGTPQQYIVQIIMMMERVI
jgi:hypothetical protein